MMCRKAVTYALDQLTWCDATWNIPAVEKREGLVMSLKARAQEKVERAGIANYSFDHDDLVMCGVRYAIEACDCGEPDCDGVRLLKAPMARSLQ
jgi:hypothetical protein